MLQKLYDLKPYNILFLQKKLTKKKLQITSRVWKLITKKIKL